LSQSLTSEAHAPRLAPSADTCGSGASPPATAAAASPSAAPKAEWRAAGCSTSCDLERSSRSSSVGAPSGSRLCPRKARCSAAGRETLPNQCASAWVRVRVRVRVRDRDRVRVRVRARTRARVCLLLGERRPVEPQLQRGIAEQDD
jgi:hypothetical protein